MKKAFFMFALALCTSSAFGMEIEQRKGNDQSNMPKKITDLIKQGVNATDHRKRTPLHLVTEGFRCDEMDKLAELLLQKEANVNAADECGCTPLINAVQFGHIKIALKLIAAKANIHATNCLSRSALHYAAQCGHTEIALALIAAEAKIDPIDKYDHTPLHYTLMSSDPEIPTELLRSGADPFITYNKHKAPIDYPHIFELFNKLGESSETPQAVPPTKFLKKSGMRYMAKCAQTTHSDQQMRNDN